MYHTTGDTPICSCHATLSPGEQNREREREPDRRVLHFGSWKLAASRQASRDAMETKVLQHRAVFNYGAVGLQRCDGDEGVAAPRSV